jgi:hypothetical protein
LVGEFIDLKKQDILLIPAPCPDPRYLIEICTGGGEIQLIDFRKLSSVRYLLLSPRWRVGLRKI